MRRIVFLLFLYCLFMPDAPARGDDCPARPVTIRGGSLLPLLQDGDMVMMRPASCARKVGRGDLVVFHSGAHELPIIKIALGLPGDRFKIDSDGFIWINNAMLKNSAGDFYHVPEAGREMLLAYHRQYGGVIPVGVYLLLGGGDQGVMDSTRLGFLHENDFLMVGPGKTSPSWD